MPKPTDDEPEITAEDLLDLDDGSAPRPVLDLADALADDEPRLHPILSNKEYRAAEAKALARMEKEDKTAAAKLVEEALIEKVRGKRGLVTGNPILDEQVEIHLDLAEFADRLVINGTTYMHGGTYTVPRHVANSLREMQTRGWNHQTELDGKGLADRYRNPYNTLIDKKGVHNAPVGA